MHPIDTPCLSPRRRPHPQLQQVKCKFKSAAASNHRVKIYIHGPNFNLNQETHARTDAVVSLHRFEIYGMIQRIHTDSGYDPFRCQSCTCASDRFTSTRLQQCYCGNFQPLWNSESLGVIGARGTEEIGNNKPQSTWQGPAPESESNRDHIEILLLNIVYPAHQ
jgi:hypothetical protein